MLDEALTDEQYENEPTELEELERSDISLDRPCIRECESCLEQNFCPDKKEKEKPVDTTKIYEQPLIQDCQEKLEDTFHTENMDKCIGCQYRFTDPEKCKDC